MTRNELRVVLKKSRHTVVNVLHPSTRCYLVCHFDNRNVVSVLAKKLRGFKTRHTRADNSYLFVLDFNRAVENIRRCENIVPVRALYRPRLNRTRTRCNDNRIRLCFFNHFLVNGYSALDFRTCFLRRVSQILNKPVDFLFFRGSSRKKQLTACFFLLFGNENVKASLCERFSAHKTCRTCADNEYRPAVSVYFKRFLFMTELRIYRALSVSSLVCVCLHTFHTIKTANAPADFVLSAFLDLVSPMRIGNMRSAQAYKVLSAILKLTFRLLGTSDKVCRKHGNFNGIFYGSCHIFTPSALKRGGFKPIVVCIVSCRGNVDSIRTVFLNDFCHSDTVGEGIANALSADFFITFVNRKPYYYREILTAFSLDAFKNIEEEFHSLVKASAVFVRSLIGVGG